VLVKKEEYREKLPSILWNGMSPRMKNGIQINLSEGYTRAIA
jgi:hypothetical protein